MDDVGELKKVVSNNNKNELSQTHKQTNRKTGKQIKKKINNIHSRIKNTEQQKYMIQVEANVSNLIDKYDDGGERRGEEEEAWLRHTE